MDSPMSLATLEPFMARLDFVQWDRFTNGPSHVNAFGWIARADGRSDFLVLQLDEGWETPAMWTSSAAYSAEAARRLYGDAEGHAPCQRVEYAGLALPNVVRLQAREEGA